MRHATSELKTAFIELAKNQSKLVGKLLREMMLGRVKQTRH